MLVIFDWDGTLLNSLARIAQCMQLAAVDAGLEPRSNAEFQAIVGLGIPQALATLYPGVPQAPLDIFRDRYSHHFFLEDQSPSDLYTGVEDTLIELKSAGHHIAVATGKSRRGLARVLGNFKWEEQFHATRCADETASKPDPLMLTENLQELNYGVEDAMMVGDTEFDLEMASRLGMRRIGVSYGAHSPERLSLHQPEAIIDDIKDLLRLI